MNLKAKGTVAENQLLNMFWQKGWACLRSAGSGAMHHPGPDLLVGNKLRRLAIECKTCKGIVKYLSKDDIAQLREFSLIFGAEQWFAIKFAKLDWYFISSEDLIITNSGFKADIKLIKKKGVLFDELIAF